LTDKENKKQIVIKKSSWI